MLYDAVLTFVADVLCDAVVTGVEAALFAAGLVAATGAVTVAGVAYVGRKTVCVAGAAATGRV